MRSAKRSTGGPYHWGEAPIQLREIVDTTAREIRVKTSRDRFFGYDATGALSRQRYLLGNARPRHPRIDWAKVFLSDRGFDRPRARRDGFGTDE